MILQGKTKVLGEESVPYPLHPPQIQREWPWVKPGVLQCKTGNRTAGRLSKRGEDWVMEHKRIGLPEPWTKGLGPGHANGNGEPGTMKKFN
jgi:hypothetical protein